MSSIIINYGKDIFKCTYDCIGSSSFSTLVKPGMNILLKPNMVLAKPPHLGATTHREVTEAVIVFLLDTGIKPSNITIGESAWIGDNTKRVYKTCGYYELEKKYGIKLLDFKESKVIKQTCEGIEMEICTEALETDFLINIPVLKAHCQTNLTCNMKNLKGVISDKEKRHFHTLGLHKPIAALNKVVKTHFCVVDGICGDLTFEEGGNPVERNMIIAGEDPLLIDSYCAQLIGYDAEEIPYLKYACNLGIGRLYSESTPILTLNQNSKPASNVNKSASGLVKSLSRHIDEKEACSACYSALIYALHKSGKIPDEKIKIGQGFRGVSMNGIGVGSCTAGLSRCVKGCPPKATDILELLNTL